MDKERVEQIVGELYLQLCALNARLRDLEKENQELKSLINSANGTLRP